MDGWMAARLPTRLNVWKSVYVGVRWDDVL